MSFTANDQELRQFDIQLTQMGKGFDGNFIGRTLKEAAKPALDAARQEVPVGQTVHKSGLTRTSRSGRTVRDGTYDKGGATKRDLRIKIGRPNRNQIAAVVVGVNANKGHVGFRTPFITLGTKQRRNKKGANRGRMTPNQFLQRAESRTINVVISRFNQSAQVVIDRALRNYAR